ncbi:MAG: hypothetical protein F6K04_11620 [Leptolyngbya sp. SIO4C5]|uniref:DUF6464 family protein n=1 Tax=Sphaerothrix gracilis TaxID=3151835 RepID=UPI0013BF1051|nr:hypothetical protein [Leptolyngbya sp. SIO4C5]
MTVVAFIIFLGISPALISLLVGRRAGQQTQQQLALAMEAAANRGLRALAERNRDRHYVEGLGHMVGDITCQFNARSPYLRCAVNPLGPCETCQYYQSKPI